MCGSSAAQRAPLRPTPGRWPGRCAARAGLHRAAQAARRARLNRRFPNTTSISPTTCSLFVVLASGSGKSCGRQSGSSVLQNLQKRSSLWGAGRRSCQVATRRGDAVPRRSRVQATAPSPDVPLILLCPRHPRAAPRAAYCSKVGPHRLPQQRSCQRARQGPCTRRGHRHGWRSCEGDCGDRAGGVSARPMPGRRADAGAGQVLWLRLPGTGGGRRAARDERRPARVADRDVPHRGARPFAHAHVARVRSERSDESGRRAARDERILTRVTA
jgi:hypothetical protein